MLINTVLEEPHRTTAILVGLLFLTSTAAFAVGSSLVDSYFAGQVAESSLVIGVALEAYTGLAVAGIGLAMLPILGRHHMRAARTYLALRVLECLTITAIGAYMLTTKQPVPHDDLMIYSFTAVGGVIFAWVLLETELIPRALAWLAVVGYVVLLFGVAVVLLGLADFNTGVGMAFFVPGGLFELILPFWLFVKGFSIKPRREAIVLHGVD